MPNSALPVNPILVTATNQAEATRLAPTNSSSSNTAVRDDHSFIENPNAEASIYLPSSDKLVARYTRAALAYANAIAVIPHTEITPSQNQANYLLAQAKNHWQQGNGAAAEQQYQEWIHKNPHDVEGRIALGQFYATQQRAEEALQQFGRALELEPKNATAIANLTSLQKQADPIQRQRIFARLLNDSADNDLPYLHFLYANSLAETAQWESAQKEYFRTLQLDSTNADYAFNLAVSLEHLNQIPAARDFYQRAITLAADKPAFARIYQHSRARLQQLAIP